MNRMDIIQIRDFALKVQLRALFKEAGLPDQQRLFLEQSLDKAFSTAASKWETSHLKDVVGEPLAHQILQEFAIELPKI